MSSKLLLTTGFEVLKLDTEECEKRIFQYESRSTKQQCPLLHFDNQDGVREKEAMDSPHCPTDSQS